MKIKSSLLFLLITMFLYTSCSDNTPEILPQPEPEVELSSKKDLLSFTLDKSKNEAYLEEDIVGTIENEAIKLTISEKVDAKKLIASFTHNGENVLVSTTAQVSEVTANDFSNLLVYTVEAEDKTKKNYIVNVEWIKEDVVVDPEDSHIPHLYIDTDDGLPITIKKEYKKANLKIAGGGKYEDFEGNTSIRGRGNSTWGMPKKPYRLKLDEKTSLLGLAAEKDWVLLQNYIDPSLMSNAVAMKTGQLLEMPFTHHMIPVDVTLNGEYLGNYMLTEQKEVKESRINIGKDGWLIELDVYYDEEYKFYSNNFKLPVMIQYPKLDKMTEAEATPIFNEMKSDFNVMEALIFAESFPNNNYLDYFDAKAFVNYLIVYTLTGNEEINHPKSTYMYKKKGEKYNMGPIWDFDWAFGYEGTNQHFVNPTRSLFWNGSAKGTRFFSRITQDPVIRELYRKEWANFKSQKYPLLREYLEEYAETIRESHAADQKRWGQSSGSIDKYLARLLDYLDKRVVYMDSLYN